MALSTDSSRPVPQRDATKSDEAFVSSKPMLLQDPDADTLAYFGVPPKQVDQTPEQYKAMQKHWGNLQRVHSHNIFSIHSPKLDKLMAPTMQFKTERRWRNARILPMKPEEIKYLLDLRPPSEGDDAVLLVSQLTCSDGVLKWAAAKKKIEIPANLIDGQDEFVILSRTRSKALSDLPSPKEDLKAIDQPNSPSSPLKRKSEGVKSKPRQARRIGNWQGIMPKPPQENYSSEEDDKTQTEKVEGSGKDSNDETTEEVAVIPSQYSQIRHWSALERLLHAIEGKDPMLDSAPKLWTFFSIANYFGCAQHERISGWIAAWLWTSPNWNFIQCNPEVSYRIGMGIQSLNLVRTAFALLVGEKAMTDIARDALPGPKQAARFAPTGRILEDLDEDEQTRIDHAAVVLRDRVRAVYNDLVGTEMLWLNRCQHFNQVRSFHRSDKQEQKTIGIYLQKIRNFTRSRITRLMASNYDSFTIGRLEDDVHLIKKFYSGALGPYSQYNSLPEQERAFTRCFWSALKNENLSIGDSFVGEFPNPADHSEASTRTDSSELMRQIKLKEKWRLKFISKQDIKDDGLKVQNIMEKGESRVRLQSRFRAEDKSGEETKLPIRTVDSADLRRLRSRFGNSAGEGQSQINAHAGGQTDSAPPHVPVPTTGNFQLQFATSDPDPAPQSEDSDPAEDEFGLVSDGKPCADPSFTTRLLHEVESEIQAICTAMLSTAHCSDGGEEFPITLIPHLLCLTDDEWKYLPLWAGGNDDASGGVFNDHNVPADMDEGFSGGLRGLGSGGIGRSGVDGAFSESSGVMSTLGAASRRANQGTATETETGSVAMIPDDFDVRSLPESMSVASSMAVSEDDIFVMGGLGSGSGSGLELLGGLSEVAESEGTDAQTDDLSDDTDEEWDMAFSD